MTVYQSIQLLISAVVGVVALMSFVVTLIIHFTKKNDRS